MRLNENAFKNGTEVLIFKYIPGWKNQDLDHFIRGVVTERVPSEGLASPIMCYRVLGEDGKEYYGNIGFHILGECFFLTRGLYIEYLKSSIASDEVKIRELNFMNMKREQLIQEVKSMDNFSINDKNINRRK